MYRVTKKNGTQINVDLPNWVKNEKKYNSFICCNEDDAECILLQEGEVEQQTSTYYNIEGRGDYKTFETVKVEKV